MTHSEKSALLPAASSNTESSINRNSPTAAQREEGDDEAGMKGNVMAKPSYASALSFQVNYIVGAGVVAVPRAFEASGYGLGVCFTAIITLCAFVTLQWFYEAQWRAACIRDAVRRRHVAVEPAEGADGDDDDKEEADPVQLLDACIASRRPFRLSPAGGRDDDETEDDYTLDVVESHDILEIPNLLWLLSGRASMWVWNVALNIYLVIAMWLYCVIFASAMLLVVPVASLTSHNECNTNGPSALFTHNCLTGLKIWFAVFLVIMCVLVSRNWGFMGAFQKVCTGLCYVAVLTMTITCIVGMFSKPYVGNSTPSPPHNKTGARSPPYVTDSTPFRWGSFSEIFGVMVFGQLCHYGSTVFFKIMPSGNPKKAKLCIGGALTTTCVLYTVLGLSVALYVGAETDSMATLNWSTYRRWGANDALGDVISGFVNLYPAVSVSCAYVLTTATLGSTLEVMIPYSVREAICRRLVRRSYDPHNIYPIQVSCRFFIVVLTVALCFITYRFKTVLTLAGSTGFFLLFFVPTALQVRSIRTMRRLRLGATRADSRLFTNVPMALVIGLLGLVGFVYYVYSQVIPIF